MEVETFNWDTFWSALSAISTFLAVLVSLWLARRKRKTELSLNLYKTVWFDGKIDLIITVKNVGDFPIVITQFGFCKIYDRETIDTTCKRFLKDPSLNNPFKILSGDIQLIEFELIPSPQDEYYYDLINNRIENPSFCFVVRDSENRHHFSRK